MSRGLCGLHRSIRSWKHTSFYFFSVKVPEHGRVLGRR